MIDDDPPVSPAELVLRVTVAALAGIGIGLAVAKSGAPPAVALPVMAGTVALAAYLESRR